MASSSQRPSGEIEPRPPEGDAQVGTQRAPQDHGVEWRVERDQGIVADELQEGAKRLARRGGGGEHGEQAAARA